MPRLSQDYRSTKKVVSSNRIPAPTVGTKAMVGISAGLLFFIGQQMNGEEALQRLERRRQAQRIRRASRTNDEREQQLSRRRARYRELRLAALRNNGSSGVQPRNMDFFNFIPRRSRNSSRRRRIYTPITNHQQGCTQHSFVIPLRRYAPTNSTYEHGSTSSNFDIPLRQYAVTHSGQRQEEDNENEDLGPPEVDTHHTAPPVSNRGNVPRRYSRGQQYCARGFSERHGTPPRYEMLETRECRHCRAVLFPHETSELCCKNGKTILPSVTAPIELTELFVDQSAVGKHFRQYIRAYNHVFTFTSMGVHLDDQVNFGGRGVYTFRAQGSIYHKIGSLVPEGDNRPRFLQLYIYDTDREIEHRMSETNGLKRELIERLKRILDANNPFVHTFRQMAQCDNIFNSRLILREQPAHMRQYVLPTSSQVAAIVVGGEEAAHLRGRDIIVQTVGGRLMNIQDIVGFYDPLQYPLLLPFGTYGWDVNSRNNQGTRVTCRAFYSYIFQIRRNDECLILRGGRLLQQYVVDNYVKIESQRLRWIRDHQGDIRAELYDGLQDALNAGTNNAGDIGKTFVLPSSFVGSPRDMQQRYQDAMALVQNYGKPDLFITMTCNPNWPEIKKELLPGQSPNDRPDLLTRVFKSKLEQFKTDVLKKHVLGKSIAHVHVIEFQKRGLPHMHMLLIFDENDKLHTPDDYDGIVRAEIPDKEQEPLLHDLVLKHMIHGPCGECNENSPCMEEGRCKRKFPKPFSDTMTLGIDSYPKYQRKPGHPVPLPNNENVLVDNSWVVPYNSWLLFKYDCHINVEICSSIRSVKYLYKYVYKGPDRVSLQVHHQNEIQQFVDGRWVCAPEAFWRIFKFPMNRMYPSVERLQIHLPNKNHVRFYRYESLTNILNNERLGKTMLTAFFEKNTSNNGAARQYLYREFPEYYVWRNSRKVWEERVRRRRVIGRIYTVSPSEGDRFFLRILLNHVRGPKSFEDLLTVDGIQCQTFKYAAEKRGLLESDDSIRECLREASLTNMPSALRRMFVTILVYCEPTGVRLLWDELYPFMIEDYPQTGSTHSNHVANILLQDLSFLLLQHNKSISDYDLPRLEPHFQTNNGIPGVLQDEMTIQTPSEDLNLSSSLNFDQKCAFDTIIASIQHGEGEVFFVDGPGGTGKTYLYRALLATIRSQGQIALAAATSGIAATLLPGGRTAHSRFKLPLNPDPSSICSISKQSELAELIRRATIILWDEATMTNRYAFEALDRTLRDITSKDMPFGGKVMVFGGDFRQVLPVIPKGTKAETINACIARSYLWRSVKILRLRQNMRSINDRHFSDFILRVGDGNEETIEEDMIQIPPSMLIPWEDDQSVSKLIGEIYPNLSLHMHDAQYMVERGLITPTNEHVDALNEKVIELFDGQQRVYHSFDSVENDNHNLYQPEFLNSISPGGLPPHVLKLKVAAPIMLLRNLDPSHGLCNGTRLICRGLRNNFIDAEILSGHFKGTRAFLHRIPLKTPENIKLPFDMTRRQFPVRLSFALTINKAQGQTIPHVGIYLPEHVFSHGQLYVALSRGTSKNTTKIMVRKGSIRGQCGHYTRNVVYKDVLLPPS